MQFTTRGLCLASGPPATPTRSQHSHRALIQARQNGPQGKYWIQ